MVELFQALLLLLQQTFLAVADQVAVTRRLWLGGTGEGRGETQQ
jgi:hypothetical protein